MIANLEDYPQRPSLLHSSLVVLGLPLLAAIVLVDSYALRAARGGATDVEVITAYVIFVVQTALLSAIVGWRVREELVWWAVMAWGVFLVDLQLFAIAAPDKWSTANTVGFGFASAQIAALICFGLLSDAPWQLRLTLTSLGIGLAIYFAFLLDASAAWYLVLAVQSAGAAVVCAVLRYIGFRIEPSVSPKIAEASGAYAQFSILHLFYWTTAVAIVIAFGRLVNWRSLLGSGILMDNLMAVLVFGPTLTLGSMVAVWAALGREAWYVRLPVAMLSLPGTGALLGAFIVWRSQRSRRWTGLFPYYWDDRESLEMGIAWTILAGGMLAGLLLVLRTSGQQLGRRKKTKAA